MNEQMKKWVEQSTSDEVFFSMTDEERDTRTDRLAHKALNGIVDEEVIAANERAYKNMEELFGKFCTKQIRKMFGD